MFGYHLRLALHSIARERLGSLLAILAIGLGIGAVATMATLLGELTRDPLPGRSGELFHPHLDASPPGFAAAAGGAFDPGERMTWLDAHNLLHSGMASSQAIMAGGRARLDAVDGVAPLAIQGRYATARFFALFGVPFDGGSGWSATDEDEGAHLVVLSRHVAASLFGARNAVGQIVRIEGTAFRVIGVTGDWQATPLFYGGAGGDAAYREDGFFLPLQAAVDLSLPFAGGTTCWGDSARTGDGCAWLQFWVRLPGAGAAGRYRDFLRAYAAGQRAHGRHVRIESPALLTVHDCLRKLQAVPREVFVQCGLSLAFFLVCLLDTAGLLLARFLARELDVGIRRAMGATRSQVFQRFAVEAALLGLAGGCVGVALAQAGLWLVRRRPDAYASLAHMHAGALLAALGASLLAALAAGALPAWRACRVAPAANLRCA
jgi:putative ABC transport system permease protein